MSKVVMPMKLAHALLQLKAARRSAAEYRYWGEIDSLKAVKAHFHSADAQHQAWQAALPGREQAIFTHLAQTPSSQAYIEEKYSEIKGLYTEMGHLSSHAATAQQAWQEAEQAVEQASAAKQHAIYQERKFDRLKIRVEDAWRQIKAGSEETELTEQAEQLSLQQHITIAKITKS